MFDKLKLWVVGFVGVLWEYVKVLFQSTLKKELELVLPIASEVVAMIAKDPSVMTDTEKRDSAFNQIKDLLVGSQKTVGSSVINLAIELALQKLKAV